MKIDLIIIGGELIHGKRTDLNGQELARQLRPLGHEISSMIVVPDDLDVIIQTIHHLRNKELPQLIITSGGMGPTADDVTKQALSLAFNSPLIDSEKAREICKENYSRHKRQWEPGLNSYQLIPEICLPLNNPVGHAPGLLIQEGNLSLLSLPGVPQEFAGLLAQELQKGLIPQRECRQFFTFKTKEIAEEVIFGKLCPTLWQDLENYGPVSSLPHAGSVEISVFTDPANFPRLQQMIMDTPLVDHIWQIGDLPTHEFIFQKLREKKKTLSVAESCSGGLCSHLFTEIPGSSDVFFGGVICYTNASKVSILGVEQSTIDKFSEVSLECAKEMANGVRVKLGADYGLSFTGFAGPSGGNETDPVGTVYIGVSTANQTQAFRHHFYGQRSFLKQKFVQYGFYRLIDQLKKEGVLT